MSNFGREQLLKQGWTEGKGLGKNEDGISQAIKPMLKLDNAGIGYKETSNENPWWQTLYNNAAKNIKVESHEDQVSLSVIDKNQNTILSEKTEKNESCPKYTKLNFVKGNVFRDDLFSKSMDASACLNAVKSDCTFKESEKKAVTDLTPALNTPLPSEQLYAVTGSNRTTYNMKLSGKLRRIAQQDKMLLGMLVPGKSTGANSTSQCDMGAFDNETLKCQLRHLRDLREKMNEKLNETNKFLYTRAKFLTDARKEEVSYAERVSKIVQKWSDLKVDDAKFKQGAPINKRKRNQDCVIQIDPVETENIYFFKKKPEHSSLHLSLEKVVSKVGNQEQKSYYEQIEMNIKQKIKEQESGNKQLEMRSSCQRTELPLRYLNLARMYNIMLFYEKEYIRDKEFLEIKQILHTNRHLDLASNIEKSTKEYPWFEMSLRKVYLNFTLCKLQQTNKILSFQNQKELERELIEEMERTKI